MKMASLFVLANECKGNAYFAELVEMSPANPFLREEGERIEKMFKREFI